jgi:hypothetical protein
MSTEMNLLFDFSKVKKNKNDTIHFGVDKVVSKLPKEYIGSATFSMVLDASIRESKIFAIKKNITSGPIITNFSKM